MFLYYNTDGILFGKSFRHFDEYEKLHCTNITSHQTLLIRRIFLNSTKRHRKVSAKYKTVQIEKNEMGGACSTYGGKNSVEGVGGET